MQVHDPFSENDPRWQPWDGPTDDSDQFSMPYSADQGVRRLLSSEIESALRRINSGE